MDDTKIEVVDVRFKNGFSKAVLKSCAVFATWRCHGCMKCMKFCLEKNTYETLMRTYAEFVISCGSGLAPVNIFIAKENNARNIVVMKPGVFMGLRNIALAIIPKHDHPHIAENVLQTISAPNLIDEEILRSSGERLKDRVRLEKEKRVIGLLIGGDTPEFSLTDKKINKVIDEILKFCDRYDAELLVTTSRRTNFGVEQIVKNRLGKDPRCRMLVIANENNPDEAIGGILYFSRVVVVSGESISMVSEAIGSGRRVIVFELDKKSDTLTKHEQAMRDLEREGYVAVSEAEGLASAIEIAWKDTSPAKIPDDRKKILEAVRRLI